MTNLAATLTAYLISLIRTAAAIVAGWLISVPAARPLLDQLGLHDTVTVSAAVAGVFMFAFYAAARWLEERFPTLGFLLIVPAKPVYGAAAGPKPLPFDTSDITPFGTTTPAPPTDQPAATVAGSTS